MKRAKYNSTIKAIKIRTMQAYRVINNNKALSEADRLNELEKCANLQDKAIREVKRIFTSYSIN